MDPTPYKISTITATGSINANVDLNILFQHVKLSSPDKQGIHYVEYGPDNFRGSVKRKTKRKSTSKRFDNQSTMLLYINGFYANCKVFRNGCVQLTGLRRIEHGPVFIQYIIEAIKEIKANVGADIVADVEALRIQDYHVRLINTDFNIGFMIRRDNLYRYMMQFHKNMYSNFEPCIYSGVKIHYFHNDLLGGDDHDGVCRCSKPCNGRGRGYGDGDCKKITIAVFRSGCVLVTGGSEYKHIDNAYAFVCKLLKKCKDDIHMEMIVEPEPLKKRLTSPYITAT